MEKAFDFLIIDEASQMSLANLLVMAQEIGFGCYFYLPKEKTSLKKYLSYGYNNWVFSEESNFTKEY